VMRLVVAALALTARASPIAQIKFTFIKQE
jgi:hypothetical protein